MNTCAAFTADAELWRTWRDVTLWELKAMITELQSWSLDVEEKDGTKRQILHVCGCERVNNLWNGLYC